MRFFIFCFMVVALVYQKSAVYATLPTNASTCEPDADPCEIWLTITERLTMFNSTDRYNVTDGLDFREKDDNAHQSGKYGPKTTDEEEKVKYDVIMVDGWEKTVIVVNDTIPGPALIVYQNQNLVIHVTNNLISEAVTIHWHGQHQLKTCFSDGVSFITQCPILPGQTFAYKFKAAPSGTFFYHSHIGGQRVDGLFGALIVRDPPSEETTDEEKPEEFIMHVGDWYHKRSSELHSRLVYDQKERSQPIAKDGTDLPPFGWQSAYIEGRGQYYDKVDHTWTEAPNTVYNVTKDKKYRFRVIGSGLVTPLRVSIDNHMMDLVASDGYDIIPREIESFVINPGERYDFVLTASKDVENYWIRAVGFLEDEGGPDDETRYVRAVLHYDGADIFTEPREDVSKQIDCKTETGTAKKCIVANCPSIPKGYNTECLSVHDLKMSEEENDREPVAEFNKDDGSSKEIFLNWITGGKYPWKVINGNYFKHPSVSSLTQHNDIQKDIFCNPSSCPADELCECYHELRVEANDTVQLVWTNVGGKDRADRNHPIHLHGHSFHVLKIGFGNYNEETGLFIKGEYSDDIKCDTETFCNHPTWSNDNWGGNKIPGLNLDNPIQKDTLVVPAGGYAVVRFKANNPGKWFMHCHIEFHSMTGMAMVLNEALDQQPERPAGFPVCQSYFSDDSKNPVYVKANNEEDESYWYELFVVFVTLFSFETFAIIVGLLIIFVPLPLRRSSDEERIHLVKT